MNRKVKEAFEGLRSKVSGNPAGSEAVFTVRTRLVSDVTCEAQIRKFPSMVIDEPPSMGGADAGPNPVELMAAALGTCQEIMYACFAAIMGIELERVEVQVKGYLDMKGILALDEKTPAGFSEIRFETRINSPASQKEIKELIGKVEAHCPVLDTLARPIPVQGKAWLNGRKLRL